MMKNLIGTRLKLCRDTVISLNRCESKRRNDKTYFVEKKFLKNSNSKLTAQPSVNDNTEYDADKLRAELSRYGFSAGPITDTTRSVYLKKLYELVQKGKPINESLTSCVKKVYSRELQKTLQNPNCLKDPIYKRLEGALSEEFNNPDPTKKLREGVKKYSFSYLLLDPRVTNNLPTRADNLNLQETWKTFLNSIFYVGKGKHSRYYSHLHKALNLWQSGISYANDKTSQHILDIWRESCGIICLRVFQNVIPIEAYTREAAMIQTLRIDNLKNNNLGRFYGASWGWTRREQNMLGAFLLYKSMNIFLNEGERQLGPNDIN
ncbi:hypothetical protein FQR65_LT04435 [Abscondita terminalis]|nr:hypothetical protein FQR65_LT04435 [Abscondita terminalis]